jgi:hypothetical protein
VAERYITVQVLLQVDNVTIQPPIKGKNSRSDYKPHLFPVTNLHLEYTVFIFGQDIYFSETSVQYNFQELRTTITDLHTTQIE